LLATRAIRPSKCQRCLGPFETAATPPHAPRTSRNTFHMPRVPLPLHPAPCTLTTKSELGKKSSSLRLCLSLALPL